VSIQVKATIIGVVLKVNSAGGPEEGAGEGCGSIGQVTELAMKK
jgi:hypothetical protein